MSGAPINPAARRGPARRETSRLVLTPPLPSDVSEVFARYASDPRVTRYLSWPRHRAVEETRGFLAFSEAEWQRWPAGPYLIRSRADGRLLGGTGLSFSASDRAVTGYVLAADAWGQGYATETLLAMIEIAAETGVRELSALCHPAHAASLHVLDKGGFRRDPHEQPPVIFPNLGTLGPQPVLRYVRAITQESRR